MFAALMRAPGELVLEDVPDPSCPAGGAFVKVEAYSVFGTDVKMLEHGHKDLRYPMILGHEIVGRILPQIRFGKILNMAGSLANPAMPTYA